MKKIILGLAVVSAFNLGNLAFASTDESREEGTFRDYEVGLTSGSDPISRSPASSNDLTSTISDDIRGGYSSPLRGSLDQEKSQLEKSINSMTRDLKSTEHNIDQLENQIMAANKKIDTYAVRRLRNEIIKRRIERKGFAEDIRALRQRLNQLGG
ncbi:MAG: hypothetical protein AABZ55_04820 [Bdellovibrionota bacterium]